MASGSLLEIRAELERRKGQERLLQVHTAAAKSGAVIGRGTLENAEQALIILQTVATATQKELEFHVSELVSLAMEAVFPDPYTLRVGFVIRRGKSEADLSFVRKGAGPEDAVHPMSAAGGGTVDVAAFALRVALWSMRRPRYRPTLVLDEPFRFVSRDLMPRAAEMLREVSGKLGLQFIVVTHDPTLAEGADRVFTVERGRDGVSRVTREGAEAVPVKPPLMRRTK